MSPGRRAARIAWWVFPALLCLLVFRRGFSAWFRADDFAWLGLDAGVHGFRDVLAALFLPAAQGTFRPLSERAFFMAGFGLFGLNSAPFRIVIFGTQFANLTLVAVIGNRLTGRRAAGFWAAVFWAVNASLIQPLGWASVYNQVLCALFLLLAFFFLLRRVEASESGDAWLTKRFGMLEWLTFLAGFGVQELNLVYPALAAAYTGLCARRHFSRTVPMLAVSVLYVAAHNRVAPVQSSGDYGFHFGASMLRGLATYWTWSLGPLFLHTPLHVPWWAVPAAVGIVSAGLLGFAVSQLRRGGRTAAFCLAWFVIALAPVLPLRDHMTEYYVYIPVIGVCWLAGWGFAKAWSSNGLAKAVATALALLYGFLSVPRAIEGSNRNHDLTIRVRDLVEGVARAHELHPDKAILLDGVDSDQFWNGVIDRPYRAIGIEHVYLTPGSEGHIDAHPDLGDTSGFVLPAETAEQGIERGEIVVYDVTGPQLRNITAAYASRAREMRLPQRVDVSNPLTAYLLGPEWYGVEGGHRWMPKQASLRIAGPAAADQRLHLEGRCPPLQIGDSPIQVTLTIDGVPQPSIDLPKDGAFDLSVALPDSALGKRAMQVVVSVSRTVRKPPDDRDLGLAFGVFEVR